ncbi:MAG: hypothetical protein MHM6MM_005761 [Cercozoa sp. M6MM]
MDSKTDGPSQLSWMRVLHEDHTKTIDTLRQEFRAELTNKQLSLSALTKEHEELRRAHQKMVAATSIATQKLEQAHTTYVQGMLQRQQEERTKFEHELFRLKHQVATAQASREALRCLHNRRKRDLQQRHEHKVQSVKAQLQGFQEEKQSDLTRMRKETQELRRLLYKKEAAVQALRQKVERLAPNSIPEVVCSVNNALEALRSSSARVSDDHAEVASQKTTRVETQVRILRKQLEDEQSLSQSLQHQLNDLKSHLQRSKQEATQQLRQQAQRARQETIERQAHRAELRRLEQALERRDTANQRLTERLHDTQKQLHVAFAQLAAVQR